MSQNEEVSEIIRVLKLEGQALLDCAARLAQASYFEPVQKAVALLQASLGKNGKIIVTGIGKSGKVGQKIAATLSSTGSLAVFLHPTEGLHGDLGIVRSEDAVIAISYTGNTEELIQLIPSFKKMGVAVIGMGGNSRSRLAQLCEAWVNVEVQTEACPHNLAPTSSTTLALAMGDAIAMALMKARRFDAEAFARFHPGGSLGRRLQLKVADLMHRGNDVPVLSEAASMDEVINTSTQKKLGVVLIVRESRLIGIITDGDIRRALTKKDRFFQLTAAEVMTKNPVVATPEMMAQSALELMENRPSQISILPVIDSGGNWLGVIRLHDLVKAF